MRKATRFDSGQASAELLALLPVLLAIAFAGWQVALAGQAWWLARIAADRAARAEALGTDVGLAARRSLPARLRRRAEVAETGDGVRVSIRLPDAFGVRLGRVSATSRFEEQR